MPTLRVQALISKDDPRHSSRRTVEEVFQIFRRVNEIWLQAGIRFDVTVLERKFDPPTLDDIVQAAFDRHGDAGALGQVTGQDPRHVTVIYARSIGGSSGKVFRPKRALVVVDDTKVSDSRTTAHEIGHIFDLEHWLDRPPPLPSDRPPNQLMARTQSGTDLIPRDIEHVRSRLPDSGLDVLPDGR